MSSEEEYLRSLDELVILVTNTLVITTPITTVLVTTIPVTTMTLNRYEYKPPHKTGACPWHGEEKAGWEEHLTCMESVQNWLIQGVDEALMGIPGTVAQLVQVEIHLQLQQQMSQQHPPTASGLAGSHSSSCSREAGHFAISCPGAVGGSAPAKDLGKKKQDTPLKKGLAKLKVQCALQFEAIEESSSSTSAEEDEPPGKG
ncbi:UNVERIFIED_CONTAM: hypothetical protein K2H54_074417 [Gekko kuhli]